MFSCTTEDPLGTFSFNLPELRKNTWVSRVHGLVPNFFLTGNDKRWYRRILVALKINL